MLIRQPQCLVSYTVIRFIIVTYLDVGEPVDSIVYNLAFYYRVKSYILTGHLNLTTHTFNYLNENLSCLFYGVDVLATRYAFFASYHDLLADVSEAFGVWVALLVLVTSSLAVLVVAQQTSSFS